MDIEGCELDAIRGARETIKEYKPKLAISIYHRPEDVITIPNEILTIRHDYKFFIRHYTFGESETVLYGI